MTKNHSDHYLITRKVTLVGSFIDGFLGLLKITVGLIGQSQALVADGVHSLSDLASDILVIWAAKHADAGPDENHPYGHERIETLATIVLAITLFIVAAGFLYDAILRILSLENLQHPGWLVMVAAAISVLLKEGIYHYTLRAARQLNSKLLKANAWHSRSDAASSVIVLLGVVGVMLGFSYADALASIGVSLMIGWVGWQLGRDGVHELIDTSLDSQTVKEMRTATLGVEGVRNVHRFRTRQMAGKAVMDAHITVDPLISVSEGHRIGDAVERGLRAQFSELSDITIHVDHEDDDVERPAYHLPLRGELMAEIEQHLGDRYDGLGIRLEDFKQINLHYIGGMIRLEFIRELAEDADMATEMKLQAALSEALQQITDVEKVQVRYQFRES